MFSSFEIIMILNDTIQLKTFSYLIPSLAKAKIIVLKQNYVSF